MSTEKSTKAAYWKGFLSSILLLVSLAAVARVAEWIAANPFPEAFIELMTKPMFSVYDVITTLLLLIVLYVVLWMVAFGPRGM